MVRFTGCTPTVWGKEVVERAFQHLGMNHPLGHTVYLPPEEEGDWHEDDNVDEE